MAIGGAKPQKGFAQRGKNCARIASEFGAEILRSIEHAGLPEEIDAPVDLVHVVPGAQRVQRELRSRRLTGLRSGPDGHQGGVDAARARLGRAPLLLQVCRSDPQAHRGSPVIRWLRGHNVTRYLVAATKRSRIAGKS